MASEADLKTWKAFGGKRLAGFGLRGTDENERLAYEDETLNLRKWKAYLLSRSSREAILFQMDITQTQCLTQAGVNKKLFSDEKPHGSEFKVTTYCGQKIRKSWARIHLVKTVMYMRNNSLNWYGFIFTSAAQFNAGYNHDNYPRHHVVWPFFTRNIKVHNSKVVGNKLKLKILFFWAGICLAKTTARGQQLHFIPGLTGSHWLFIGPPLSCVQLSLIL